MTWNHRVIKHKHSTKTEDIFYYQIHEVYYDDKGEIDGYTMDPISPQGEDSLENLRVDMNMMMRALDKPVLNKEELDKRFSKDK